MLRRQYRLNQRQQSLGDVAEVPVRQHALGDTPQRVAELPDLLHVRLDRLHGVVGERLCWVRGHGLIKPTDSVIR
jgi:hypothetical protein